MVDAKELILSFEYFITETDASGDDCLKALEKLREGLSVEKVIRSWRKKEAAIGAMDAKKAMIEVVTMADCHDDMIHDLMNGKEKGTTTYIKDLDNAWTWRRGEFNIWTGYANEGKSLFTRFIALVKALNEGWKFAFYAPEDYPAKEFFDDILHTAAGKSTDISNQNFVGEALYNLMYERVKELFYFVYIRPPENDLITILKEFKRLIRKKGIQAGFIDPLIKVARPSEYMMADDKYAGYVTTVCTDFSRQYNVSLHLVMHQLTPNMQENGLYPQPSMYKVKGGGTWADGSDNINSVWRPTYAKDKLDDEVMFSSLKIKKQKLVGIPQDIRFRFNPRTNRYINHENKKELFDFEGFLRGGKQNHFNFEEEEEDDGCPF